MPVSLKDDAVVRAVAGAVVAFPVVGALRVHPNPASVYRPKAAPRGQRQRSGPNRFDDPHHHYPVRYLAEQLTVCLLEVLARLRANPDAEQALEEMSPGLEDPALVDLVDPTPTEGLAAFLATNKVALFTPAPGAPLDALVDVFDPDLLAALDGHHRVREQLRRPQVIAAYGDQGGVVHLDGSLIRNANATLGRPVTQEISRLLIEIIGVQGLRYSSRHSEHDQALCWALNGDVPIRPASIEAINPDNAEHRKAVQDVAHRYDLTLPATWARPTAPAPAR